MGPLGLPLYYTHSKFRSDPPTNKKSLTIALVYDSPKSQKYPFFLSKISFTPSPQLCFPISLSQQTLSLPILHRLRDAEIFADRREPDSLPPAKSQRCQLGLCSPRAHSGTTFRVPAFLKFTLFCDSLFGALKILYLVLEFWNLDEVQFIRFRFWTFSDY